MVVTNGTGFYEFPVIGFATAVVSPFTDAFSGIGTGSGNIFFLIMFGLLLMMLWRQSGKTTIPTMVAAITGGAFSMLYPESFTPYVEILFAVAIASQLLTFFAKED